MDNLLIGVLRFIFYFTCFFNYSTAAEWEVDEILNCIPIDDRECLASLFHHLISDHFGYTLFSDKAVSLSGQMLTPSPDDILTGFDRNNYWKQWKIWERYQNQFKITRFLLLKETSKKVDGVCWIILINRESFINEVVKNQQIFNKILGRDVDAESLLNQISRGEISFQNAIGNQEILWGILLGYGRHNAELFGNREHFKKVCSQNIWSKEMIVKFEKKIEDLNLALQPFGKNYYYPLRMHSIHCVADPNHPETKILKSKYEKLQSQISTIYSKGDFLRVTLSQLCSSDSGMAIHDVYR